MPLITHTEIVTRFMPDIIELWINHECIYRAQASDETCRTAGQMEGYFIRLGDRQRS